MAPNATVASSQQPNGRKRTGSERVVPVVPLSLGKAKPAKSKPKAEISAQDGAYDAANDVQPNVQEQPILNGGAPSLATAPTVQDVATADGVVTMPAADTPGSRGSAAMSLSFGGTPEIPATESPQSTTPPLPQPSSISSTASPESSRKPTGIRTELPPAFVPSAEQHTPKSAGSSQASRPLPYRQYVNPAYPSASSIVFGGQDSTTSSPAPPQSAGSSAFMPPPFPSFGSAPHPYFNPSGHAHHASEPYGQRMYQASYGQPTTPWHVRQQFQPAPMFHPHGHMPFRYPPRDAFTPAESQQLNGRGSRSRSASRASSATQDQQKLSHAIQSPVSPGGAAENTKMMFSEPKAAFTPQNHPRHGQFNSQGPQTSSQFHPDIAANLENLEALRVHMLSCFSNSTFTDCQLHVTNDYDNSEWTSNAHKVVLSRSPTLAALMMNIQPPPPGSLKAQLSIHLNGQYIRADSFMDAIKFLYGGPLPQLDHQRPGSSAGEQIPSNIERMEMALRNVATGAWLKITPFAGKAVEQAGSLLHWDTLATALGFALDGGLSQIWNVDDGSEDRASTSSSDDSPSRLEPPAAVPTHEPYSTHLLQRIVDFLVHVFPPNFFLDTSAPQISSCPRLPSVQTTHETRSSRSDPRLSQIRFGDIPVEDHSRPSFATTTVSSVLVSLPFPILKCVLEHYELSHRLGIDTVASIMRQVVAERESRRIKVRNARVGGQMDENIDPQAVQNLYWEEDAEMSSQHRAGFRLARRKREVDTPPSSGACSERNK